MSWTDVYPFLTDEMLDIYQAEATTAEKSILDEYLTVRQIFNRQESSHLVVTALAHRPGSELADGTLREPSAEDKEGGAWMIWHSYQRLLEGAWELRNSKPGIVLRVYLAGQLSGLVPELTALGCEVFLMHESSPEHSATLWRFLALKEKRWLTFTDAGFGRDMLHDVERTEHVMATPLGAWRAPYLTGDKKERLQARSYRPIQNAHFGLKGGLPGELMLRALLWHTQRGSIDLNCVEQDGNRGYPIQAATWPGESFDEWLLLAAVYPRIAFDGVLTFLIWQRKTLSHWYLLDIEYVTWANSGSEVMLSIKHVNPDAAWTTLPESSGLTVRPDTTVILRARRRVYEGYNAPELDEIVASLPLHEGDLPSLLQWATAHIGSQWWVDLSTLLKAGANGTEVFLDRRYGSADVVTCGFIFIRITAGFASWATAQGLDGAGWRERAVRKVPKLEGPLTLWKTSFSRTFSEALAASAPNVPPELVLSAWVQQGKAVVMHTTAGQMGWKLRI